MAYPPRPSRRTSYTQANNAGQVLSVANLDAEHNDFVEQIDQLNTFVRGITTAAGTLKNLATATAQALSGSQRLVATASQTMFISTIAYLPAFSNANVHVFSQGLKIDSNLVVVANSGGFLQVTIPAQTVGYVVSVAAFESGAGLLTRLMNVASASDGANMIGVQDVGALIAATTVEGALAEIVTNLNTFIAAVGSIANIFKADGSVTATGNFNLGARRITNMADGIAATDAATVAQVNAAITTLATLANSFIRRDGTNSPSGITNWGGFRFTNLGTPTASTDAATKGYVDTATASASPVGTVVAFAGGTAPSGWVLCNGASYSTLTTYAGLYAVIGITYGNSGGVNYFNVPDLRGRLVIGAGTGANDGGAASGVITGGTNIPSRTVGQWYGSTKHTQTVAEMAAHTHDVTTAAPGVTIAGVGGGSVASVVSFSANSDGNTANHPTTTSTGNAVANPMNIDNPAVVLNYIIKY